MRRAKNLKDRMKGLLTSIERDIRSLCGLLGERYPDSGVRQLYYDEVFVDINEIIEGYTINEISTNSGTPETEELCEDQSETRTVNNQESTPNRFPAGSGDQANQHLESRQENSASEIN